MATKTSMTVTVNEIDGDTREVKLGRGATVGDIPNLQTDNVVLFVKEAGNGYTRATTGTTLRDGDQVLVQKAEGKYLR